MNCKRTLVALGAIAMIALPATAFAKDGHGKAPKPPKAERAKPVNFEFKGLVTAVGDGTIAFEVKAGNHRAKALKGQVLTLDVSKARIVVRDVNKDGKRNLADVAVGDRLQAQVKTKLRRGEALDTSAALPARHVVDKGPVPPKDDTPGDESTEAPETETPAS